MKKVLLLLVILLCFTSSFAQEKLFLRSQKKHSKTKKLDLTRSYGISTQDTSYYSQILGFTDSSLFVKQWVDTGLKEVDAAPQTYELNGQKVNAHTKTVYRIDTVSVAFSDVVSLERSLLRNTRWVEPFAWMGVGAVLGAGFLPVAILDDGGEHFDDWLIFEGTLIAVSGPPIFLASRKIKYDLTHKWVLATE